MTTKQETAREANWDLMRLASVKETIAYIIQKYYTAEGIEVPEPTRGCDLLRERIEKIRLAGGN